MSRSDQAARAVVSELAGREVIARIAPLLLRAGIPLMPLKGVWLQACVYGAAGLRVITDVDVLVPEPEFARALEVLARDGFRSRGRHTASEQALEHPALRLPVDLHCRLFTPGAFRMATPRLFERATPDSAVFGTELLLPDPLDVFAHLIGHFVKSRTHHDDRARLMDFTAIASRCRLDPALTAAHLHAVGMARAVRYVLHEPASAWNDAFCAALLAELPSDLLGDQLVAVSRWAAGQGASERRLGALTGFLLDRSLGAGALALALRVHERASQAVGAHRPRPV